MTDALTAEEAKSLAAHLMEREKEWLTKINFSSYKAYSSERDRDSKDHDEILESKHKKDFEELQKTGLRRNIICRGTKENPLVIHFITQQLKSKKVWALMLEGVFSERDMDSIFDACLSSSIGGIFFDNPIQEITNRQAIKLLACLKKSTYITLSQLPGKNISKEVAEEFAIISENSDILCLVEMNDSPFFSKKKSDLFFLERCEYQPIFLDFRLLEQKEDIETLAKKIAHSKSKELQFKLCGGEYTNPAWVDFFNTVLTSSANITVFSLSSDIVLSKEVMFAIVNALGKNHSIQQLIFWGRLNDQDPATIEAFTQSLRSNKTLRSLELRINNPKVIQHVVSALYTHPSLVELRLSNSTCIDDETAAVIQQLIVSTPALQSLYLVDCYMREQSICRITSKLGDNTTLTGLYLSGNTITPHFLMLLGRELAKNKILLHISFLAPSVGYTIQDLAKFSDYLDCNESITEISYRYPSSAKPKKVKLVHDDILRIEERNKKLAKLPRLISCQTYVETAILLIQAARVEIAHLEAARVKKEVSKQKIFWSIQALLDQVLSFLVPPTHFSSPSSTKLHTDLIRTNLFSREWKSSANVTVTTIWGDEKIRTLRFFEKHPKEKLTPHEPFSLTEFEKYIREYFTALPKDQAERNRVFLSKYRFKLPTHLTDTLQQSQHIIRKICMIYPEILNDAVAKFGKDHGTALLKQMREMKMLPETESKLEMRI